MYVTCDACNYDSGDYDTPDEVAHRVNVDGGFMEMQYDETGLPDGWKIRCPKNCGEQYTHLD